MSTVHAAVTQDCDYDVVVVGGGPAGCSAAVFAARDGLDALVFDRGRSSIQQCAHLENYLGFPAGIDVETLYALVHDHVAQAGCERRDDLVEDVARREAGETTEADGRGDDPAGSEAGDGTDAPGFVVAPADGDPVTARRVVAATRYDGEYLRGLDDDEAMFERYEYDGETCERFDREYAGRDGSTPVDGLYVASPSAEADRQAIVAAGRGARVGLAVVEAARVDRGVPDALAKRYDWLRRDAERSDEWRDRDRWREWFDDRLPEGHGLDDDRLAALRERTIDARVETYVDDDEIARRRERGHDRLLEALDDDRVLARAREIRAERDGDAGSDGTAGERDGSDGDDGSDGTAGERDEEALEVTE